MILLSGIRRPVVSGRRTSGRMCGEKRKKQRPDTDGNKRTDNVRRKRWRRERRKRRRE